MSRAAHYALGLLLLAILIGSGVALIHTGFYGYTVFVVHPFLLGALTSWTFRPSTGMAAADIGCFAVMVAAGVLYLIGMEGAICVLISLPLTLPLGALGGWLVRRLAVWPLATRGGLAMMLLLPPASLVYDAHARPPIYQVRTTITIAAPPAQVWPIVVGSFQLPAPDEWYFRAGLAYPTRGHIEGTGEGATRYCDFSTGPVVESIEVWDAPRRLRFRVTETPAAMREWSPYGEIAPKHLQGYLISREGEFRLTLLPGNRTLLEGTSWYQHGLWPAQYWRWWSDAVIHRVHLRVFHHIQTLAEAHPR